MTIRTTFPDCGRPASAILSQRDHDGRLVWGLSVRCDVHSNHAIEVDGWGLPDHDIRDQVLDDEGPYELVLAGNLEIVRALRSLQTTLDLDLTTISLLRKRIPGRVLSGTRSEIEWLVDRLQTNGVAASVEPAGPDADTRARDISDVVPVGWTGRPRT